MFGLFHQRSHRRGRAPDTATARCLALCLAVLLLLTGASAQADPERLSTGGNAARNDAFLQQVRALGIPLNLPPGKAILVNIPSYELIAFEDGVPVLRSRVIVGTPKDRTPRMDSYTSLVVMHPAWVPPPPLVARGEVSPGMRPPGPDNPMGKAAIRLQPDSFIYMHDTNQRHLFDRERRAYSHGCIRVERWDELIAWLLDAKLDWVTEKAAGPESTAYRTPNVPVMLRYYRRFPTEDGRIVVHPDIYGLGRG